MPLLARPSRPILCYVTDRRSLPLSTSADAHHLLFDSVEKAAAAHDSPGYQAALKVLGNAVERDLRIVEGLA